MTITQRSTVLLAIGVIAFFIASEHALIGQTAGARTQAQPQAKANPSPAPRLTRLMVAAIQEFATDPKDCSYGIGSRTQCRLESDFFPLMDFSDGSSKLVISSSRQTIAYSTWKASSTNGRYTAPSNLPDTVSVQCGDSDIGDIFECSRVRVLTPTKAVVKALAYVSGPKAYKNMLGARWTVREVAASYPILQLREGFSVEYASFDGTEWTFEVSSEDAKDRLLLRLPETGVGVPAAKAKTSPVAGRWVVNLASPAGAMLLNLAMDVDVANKVTGLIDGPKGPTAIKGEFKDEVLRFSFPFDVGGQIVQVSFEGKLDGESKMVGTMSMGEIGRFPFTAERGKGL